MKCSRTSCGDWKPGCGAKKRRRARGLRCLLDFVPVASGQTKGAYRTGENITATLVFYPPARPLRALIKEMTIPTQECSADLGLPEDDLANAYAGYEDALATIPWINMWPLRFREARVRRNGENLFACSALNDAVTLPIMANQANAVSPLLAIDKFDGFGLWDGYAFRLCFAQTPLGRWVSE